LNADWEVEIGGDAPVIEALWPGFIDLRSHPERVTEIGETAIFPPLAALLQSLNALDSPLWSSKCDVWLPEPGAIALYIDMLPREGLVFAQWQQAAAFCRDFVFRIARRATDDCTADLVIRQAIAGEAAGFGITAYVSATGLDPSHAATLLAAAIDGFSDALPRVGPPAKSGSKLQ
jgi:hypothetical protein